MFNRNKIKIWAVSNVPEDCDEIEFENNLVTFLGDKKQLEEYILNSYILTNLQHFKQWLEYRDLEDIPINRLNYAKSDPETYFEYRSGFCCKPYVYNRNSIAGIIRLLATTVPVGASYELELETAAYNKIVLETLKEGEVEENGDKQEG